MYGYYVRLLTLFVSVHIRLVPLRPPEQNKLLRSFDVKFYSGFTQLHHFAHQIVVVF